MENCKKTFEAALALFLSSSLEGCFHTIQEPSYKTLSDRFKKVIADHRLAVRSKVAVSGITKIQGEREVLLDDIVLEMDEWAEQRRMEREEKTEFDKRLQGAGEEMREKAPNRVSPNDGKGDSPSDCRVVRYKRRFSVDQRDEEHRDLLAAHVKIKADMEQKRLKLDEERLEFERRKGTEEAKRIRRSQEHDTKVLALNDIRIQLEVERAALDREERKSALDERKQIISVFRCSC